MATALFHIRLSFINRLGSCWLRVDCIGRMSKKPPNCVPLHSSIILAYSDWVCMDYPHPVSMARQNHQQYYDQPLVFGRSLRAALSKGSAVSLSLLCLSRFKDNEGSIAVSESAWENLVACSLLVKILKFLLIFVGFFWKWRHAEDFIIIRLWFLTSTPATLT